jgi:hypothetical protein
VSARTVQEREVRTSPVADEYRVWARLSDGVEVLMPVASVEEGEAATNGQVLAWAAIYAPVEGG